MPSRLTVLNPVSEIVTAYVPGRRSTTRYWPVVSVTTERIFSIRTALATSTVTPGSTAPDASLTRPVIAACARAAAGKSNNTDRTATERATTLDLIPLLLAGHRLGHGWLFRGIGVMRNRRVGSAASREG